MQTKGWSIRMAFMACSTQYCGSSGDSSISTSCLLGATTQKVSCCFGKSGVFIYFSRKIYMQVMQIRQDNKALKDFF